MFRPTERNGELVIAAILFGIGLFWVIGSRDMPQGEFSVPGPGFFPVWTGSLLCAVSAVLAFRVLRAKAVRIEIGHPFIWSTVLAIIALSIFLEGAGFLLVITLFVGFFLKMLAGLRWHACILWAVAASILAYCFFDLLLGIQLPSPRWF